MLSRRWAVPATASLVALTVCAAAAAGHARGAGPRHVYGAAVGHARGASHLAPTPYMGVNTWYAFGTRVDEAAIVSLAKAMVDRGLKTAGYRYLWLDAGWWGGARDSGGNIVLSSMQWPHGMKWLADYIHSKGLLAGIYTDAGSAGCVMAGAGSYRHYPADVNTFARWGFDAVKVDFCGGNAIRLNPRFAYRGFRAAILGDSPRRPMLFNVCNGSTPSEYGPGVPTYGNSAYAAYSFASGIANSWRTSGDIGTPGNVRFPGVLRNISHDSLHPEAARPGHWNDPDYLVPDAGMSYSEARAQFTMWAVLAAPLMLSVDVRFMPIWVERMVTNRGAIAISQDRLGVQGRLVATQGAIQVWVKPLANGDRAIALLNRGRLPAGVRAPSAALGIHAVRRLRIQELWEHRTTTETGMIKRTVAGHSALLLRVSMH